MATVIPIEVKISGSALGNKGVDGITLVYTTDNMPSASVGVHDIPASASSEADTVIKRALVSEEAEKMQKFQEAAFGGGSEKAEITINPFGHIYSGSILGPQRSIFTGYYNNGVQLTHELEKLNGYLPHIYALPQVLTNGPAEFLGATYTNVFQMVKAMLEKRQSDFNSGIETAQFKDPTSKENAIQIHKNNLTIFPIIAQICDESASKGGDTYAAFSNLPDTAKSLLNNTIFNTLQLYLFGANSSFLNTLIQIGNAFQSFYTPPIYGDSKYGYFKSNRVKVDDDSAELVSLQIVGATFSSAQSDNRPTQQIIVSGQAPRLTNANESGAENVYEFIGDNSTYAIYPKNSPVENGNNLNLPIPEWIPAHLYVYATNPAKEHSRNLDLEKRKAEKNKLAKSLKNELAGPIASVIKEYAETAYKTFSLSSYTAIVNTTLDFSLLPGKLYKVTDEDSATLFTGFLFSVTHKISGISTSLSAGTTLVFNTVKFNNFQLPE